MENDRVHRPVFLQFTFSTLEDFAEFCKIIRDNDPDVEKLAAMSARLHKATTALHNAEDRDKQGGR